RRGRAGVGADPGSDRRGSGRDDRRRRCAVGGPRRHPLAAQARPPRPGRAAGGGERRPARPHGGRDHAGVGDRRLPWPARRRLPGGVRPDRLGQGGPVPARGADGRSRGRCPHPHRDGLIPRCRGDGDRPVLKSRATSGSDSPLPLGLTPFGRRYLPPASGRGTCPGFGFFGYVAVSEVEGARSVPAAGETLWSSGSLRSRPLPASGRTPPFRCRSTGEKSFGGHRQCPPVASAPRGRGPTGLFGFLPQLAGGVARSAEGARSAGPLGNSRVSPGSLRSRPLPAFGRTPPFRCRSTGEKSFGKSSSVPVSLALHGGEGHGVGMDARIVGVNSATVSPCSPARWTASGSRPSLASRIRYASKNACGAPVGTSNEVRVYPAS